MEKSLFGAFALGLAVAIAIAVAIPITVAVAIAGGGAPDVGGAVEHKAGHPGVGPGQGLDALEDLGGGGEVLPDDVDHPVHMAAHGQGVGHHGAGRRVQHDVVKHGAQGVYQRLQLVVLQQVHGGVDGLAAGKDIQRRLLIAQEVHLVQAAGQALTQALGGLGDAQQGLVAGAPEVAVDQQDLFSLPGQGQGQVHGHGAFPLGGDGACDHDDLVLVLQLPQQLQPQQAIRLAEGAVGLHAGDQQPLLGAVFPALGGRAGDGGQGRQAYQALDVAGGGHRPPQGGGHDEHRQRQHHAQGRALDGAAHPGIGVIRRVGQGGLLVHHQLRFTQDQAVHLGIHVDDGAEDVIGVLGAGAFHRQDEEAGVLDGGGGDAAVDGVGSQPLAQQLLHPVGGQQIGEGVRHLLGGGLVVILAVAGDVGAAHEAEVHGEHRVGAVHGAEAAVSAPAHQGGAQHHQGQAYRPQARQRPSHPPQQDGQVNGLVFGIGSGRVLFHSAPHCCFRPE